MSLSDEQVLNAFVDTQAIESGHFQLTSGLHSDTYVQCTRVCKYPDLIGPLAEEALSRMPQDIACDIVVAPAVGGIVFGFAVAQALGRPFLFTERVSGVMKLRRSFEIEERQRVLVAEDVITTGGSVAEVIDVVEAQGGIVVGVVSLIDRGGKRAFAAPYFPLLRMNITSYHPDRCSLCENGIELDSPGSRTIVR